jgi:hypothetical protein
VIRSALLLFLVTCSAGPTSNDSDATVSARTFTAPRPRPAAGAACGDAPLAGCPLETWMNATLAPTLKRRDFVGLGAAFHELAELEPEGWSGWSELAEAGAVAARAASIDQVRATCAACHARFRGRYHAELRARPLPDFRGER